MSMLVYDLRSNCAAGIGPLWHPMQYFVTKGFTVCVNCWSNLGAAAPKTGRATKERMTGRTLNDIKKLFT